jgi:SWIM zinc finger.
VGDNIVYDVSVEVDPVAGELDLSCECDEFVRFEELCKHVAWVVKLKYDLAKLLD